MLRGGSPAVAPHKMWVVSLLLFVSLATSINVFCLNFLALAADLSLPPFLFAEKEGDRDTIKDEETFIIEAINESAVAQQEESTICFSSPLIDAELRRLCMMAVDHLPALYRRLSVEYEVLSPLSPEEVLSAVSDYKKIILEEEDAIAALVIAKKLPLGALPVYSLKRAIQKKLTELNRLKAKNITTMPGLMGLQIKNKQIINLSACVEALVIFFYDLMGVKFTLSKLTGVETAELSSKINETLKETDLKEADLPAVLEFVSRAVLDAVAAPSRAQSLGAALQAMPPFTSVGDDDGLAPLSFSRCLTLVRGLFPTLRAHMILHYQMKEPSEQQLQDMAQVLLPIVNAHRSRLRLSAEKGDNLLAPEEHFILWGYMEQYAREHQLVGNERPLNLWRFPTPAGAANLLD